jgi:hypothetical protein
MFAEPANAGGTARTGPAPIVDATANAAIAQAQRSPARPRTRAHPLSCDAKRTTALLLPLEETRLGQNRRLANGGVR